MNIIIWKGYFLGGIWMIQPLSLVFLNVLGNLPNNTKPPPTELPSNDHSPNAIISQAGWCLMSDEQSWAFWMTIFSIKWSVQMRNWFGGGSHQPARNKAFVLGLWSPSWSLNNPWKKRPAISCLKNNTGGNDFFHWETASEAKKLRTIVSTMLKNEGVSAFYTGLTAGLTRQVVYTGARLGLFDKFTGMVPLAGKKPSQPKEKCEVYVYTPES